MITTPSLPQQQQQQQITTVESEQDTLFMISTKKRTQRNLALKVCGFDYSQNELEEELVR